MARFRRFWPLLFTLALLTGACTNQDLFRPTPPLPPNDNPNILGLERAPNRALATLEDALVCLASRQPVYGVTVENSNVRPQTDTGDCRVGRIPQGRVVKINGVYASNATDALVDVSGRNQLPSEATLGYVEDVQPILVKTCNSCHSGLIQTKGLQVTEYAPLMAGSENGPVIVPGDAEASVLWHMVESGLMPMVGELSDLDKETIRLWIEDGAAEQRSGLPDPADLWLEVDPADADVVNNACAGGLTGASTTLVNAELIAPLSCGTPPEQAVVDAFLARLETGDAPAASTGAAAPAAEESAASTTSSGPAYATGSAAAGVQAAALGLPAPTDADGWMTPRGGFCVEQHLPDNQRSITAITFAPDGRLFLALDSPPTGEADPLVLYDAYHPSRAVAVYDPVSRNSMQEIFGESPRITGLDYANGGVFLSRSGEVGWIPDGGEYQPLAGGFAVNSQLFHANNGLVISNGWLYISAGGVRDGYSDGPLVGMDENSAQSIVSGGNGYAARIVRAALDRLLNERSINVFETAARGVRNPYGITADPAGRIWFTDNGATNVPDNISAGDEVNMFDPATATGNDATAPYYGFPLALNGSPPDWYVDPAVVLPNTAAPTGITWAYGTIFYAQYGRDPGLYRLGRNSAGQLVSERVMLVWPLLSMTTAPDGALWLGTGTGGLYRVTPGCGN